MKNMKNMSVRFVFIDQKLDKGVSSVRSLALEGADKHWQEFFKGKLKKIYQKKLTLRFNEIYQGN